VQIEKAFRQEADGQHDAALRTMDELVAQHADNPEAWGRKAQLLYLNARVEEAEAALDRAFAINPGYPFGHLLRGMFRQSEGELPGALMLFRKAVDLYAPEAHDSLATLYAMIGECEMKMNRPIAGRAAFKLSLHLQPGNDELRQEFDAVFGPESALPASAARDHAYRPLSGDASPARKAAWERALGGVTNGKLSDAARAFEQLTQEDPQDAAAWFNLGLTRAWLGENRTALEALDRSVALEADETRAAAAWALGEALRLGYGMEDQADYVQNVYSFQILDAQRVIGALQAWEHDRRLVVLEARQEQGIISGLILDRGTALAGTAPPRFPHIGAYLVLIGNGIQIWNVNRQGVERIRDELQQQAGPGLSPPRCDRRPGVFTGPFGCDAIAAAVAVPVGVSDKEEAQKGIIEQEQKYYEESWLHRPLISLGGVPPIDAVGHPVLRKKLLGIVQFLQECTTAAGRAYNFDRLRRKLGLLAPQAVAAASPAGPDIAAMSAAELASLSLSTLSDEQLEQAYQAALKLDARELAARFAEALVARPSRPDRPDRFPWYAHLVQTRLAAGDTDSALDLLNNGEKHDCEYNEGRRRNDYELRRGQIHVKRGETAEAQAVFERLIERVPGELRYRGSAAEAMLAAKQGQRALEFAEGGLKKAREKNDRDSEQYFQELVAAARKLGG
jgi:tetratricopeptide (TPR) repeat protein